MDGTSPRKTSRNSGSPTNGLPRPARHGSRLIPVALLWAVMATPPIVLTTSAAGEPGIGVQGSWAYTQRDRGGTAEFMATTRASEDVVWLVLGCVADERLTVSAIHSTQFPFPLSVHASVQLHSRRVPS